MTLSQDQSYTLNKMPAATAASRFGASNLSAAGQPPRNADMSQFMPANCAFAIRAIGSSATAGLLLQACSPGAAFKGPVSLISDQQIMVVRASAKRKKDGLLVGGDVRQTKGYAGVSPGHLRIEGRNAKGQVVATTAAPWGEFISRRFRLAYFKAFLKTDAAATVASISVKVETGAPQ